MRIGIVTTWFERGAAYVSRQYRATLEREHEVFVWARGGERAARGDARWDGERVTWGKSVAAHGNTAFRLSGFRRWIRRHALDLVLFNEQHWWPPVLLCQDLGVTTAAYVDYYTEATIPLFANYDLLLCNTRRHAGVFAWHPRCEYVPWGTDLELFAPRARAERAMRPVFFHSAGWNPQRKGTDLVLDALEQVEGGRLVLHTQVSLAERWPERSAQIERLGAAGRLELLEQSVHAPGLYHLGDVYVYPSRLEGVGLSVPEALACGLPAIVPDGPPLDEFVAPEAGRRVRVADRRPRPDGYYWPQTLVDPAALAAEMRWYVDHAARLDELGRAARRHAEQHLDWNSNSAGLCARVREVRPLEGSLRARARAEALRFERARSDVRLYFPLVSRLLLKAGDVLHPLSSRYGGRRGPL